MPPFNQAQFNSQQFGPPTVPADIGIPFGPGPGTIAYRSLVLAGHMMAGTIPEPEMLLDCLNEANSMLDSYNAQQMTQQFIDDRYFNIDVSQQSYTLGPTGTLNTDANGRKLTYRPQRIIRANLVLLNNTSTPTRIPITIIHVEDFADIPVIDIQSQVVIRMYVQTTQNNVTLWMFPFPSTGNQLEFFMWPGTPKFESIESILTYNNPAALDAIVYELAERMLPYLPKDMGRLSAQRVQWLHAEKVRKRYIFDASNAPSPTMTPDLITEIGDAQGAPFDYLYGDYSQ